MRTPRCGLEQLDLLGRNERAKLRREPLDEIPVRIDRRPMGAAVSVVHELPEMNKLVNRAGISLEVADQVFIVPAPLERGKTEFLIQL